MPQFNKGKPENVNMYYPVGQTLGSQPGMPKILANKSSLKSGESCAIDPHHWKTLSYVIGTFANLAQ